MNIRFSKPGLLCRLYAIGYGSLPVGRESVLKSRLQIIRWNYKL